MEKDRQKTAFEEGHVAGQLGGLYQKLSKGRDVAAKDRSDARVPIAPKPKH
jgi:hypothetical protein